MGTGILILGTLFGGFGLLDAPAARISELGVDRFAQDVQSDRHLATTNLHWLLREKSIDPLGITLRAGFTVSRSTGSIEQLEGQFENGTLQRVVHDSPAWGFGPTVEGHVDLLRRGAWSAGMDVSATLLVHDRRFPAGGDRYNGMLQAGPSVAYRFSAENVVTVGYRYTHVSNGQGVNAGNPSYESRGFILRHSARF